jgi:sirohydrochlorin ferrochelatase
LPSGTREFLGIHAKHDLPAALASSRLQQKKTFGNLEKKGPHRRLLNGFSKQLSASGVDE